MKLEKDHMLGAHSPPRKSYNPFDSDDEIEATNGYVRSNVNGYDIKSFETNADSLTFHLDSSDVSWEEAILNHSQILSRSKLDSNGEEVLSRKDTELFTDKIVTVDLPELMVCYKEDAYHSVKDIGIDEGMPMHDKVSFNIRDINDDINGDGHLKPAFMEGLKSRSEIKVDNDVSSGKWSQDSVKDNSELDKETLVKQQSVDECEVDDLTKLDELKLNSSKEKSDLSEESTVNLVDTGKEAFSSEDPQLNETDDSSYHKTERIEEVVSVERADNTLSMEKAHEPSPMTPITATSEASTESDESVYEETTSSLSPSPEFPTPQEPSDNDLTNVLSYNSKVDSGSIILDFNSTTPKEKKEEEISQDTETIEKPPDAQSMSRVDNIPIPESSLENRIHGETSFSAATAPPASITYTGPFAHAGNISLRSESSAGSTRSFAFPVLQADWNSSPVRMAKAERNRKHRGWVQSVMCCRF